jgi:tRNA U55 pseudouridine synthase TruB
LDQAIKLDDLQKGEWTRALLPTDRAIQHLPQMELSSEEVQRVQFGQRLERRDDHPDAPLVRIYEPGGRFLGIVSRKKSGWQPHKVFLPQ